MFSDLTHDAVSINDSQKSSCGDSIPSSFSSSSSHQQPDLKSHVPEVVHITGSKGPIQIGPTYIIEQKSHNGQRSDRSTVSKPPRELVLQMLRITRKVTDADLFTVTEHLGCKWRELGVEMGYSRGQLDNIDSDHRRLQDKTDELLTMWIDRESEAATFAQMIRLLMRVRAFDVVIKLRAASEGSNFTP